MFNKSYQIILMQYPDGELIIDYYSTIIPMVNDVIIDDSGTYSSSNNQFINTEYIVIERHFSVSNQKVVLLVEKVIETHE